MWRHSDPDWAADIGLSWRRDDEVHGGITYPPVKHRHAIGRPADVLPRIESLRTSLRAEYRAAGIDPATIELVIERLQQVRPFKVRQVRTDLAAEGWWTLEYEVAGEGMTGLPQHFDTWAGAMRFADQLARAAGNPTTQRGILAGGAHELSGMGDDAAAARVPDFYVPSGLHQGATDFDTDLEDDADDVACCNLLAGGHLPACPNAPRSAKGGLQ